MYHFQILASRDSYWVHCRFTVYDSTSMKRMSYYPHNQPIATIGTQSSDNTDRTIAPSTTGTIIPTATIVERSQAGSPMLESCDPHNLPPMMNATFAQSVSWFYAHTCPVRIIFIFDADHDNSHGYFYRSTCPSASLYISIILLKAIGHPKLILTDTSNMITNSTHFNRTTFSTCDTCTPLDSRLISLFFRHWFPSTLQLLRHYHYAGAGYTTHYYPSLYFATIFHCTLCVI